MESNLDEIKLYLQETYPFAWRIETFKGKVDIFFSKDVSKRKCIWYKYRYRGETCDLFKFQHTHLARLQFPIGGIVNTNDSSIFDDLRFFGKAFIVKDNGANRICIL